VCRKPFKCCRDIVRQPIDTWKDDLVNDFEKPVFQAHPELAAIKDKLYSLSAVYAAMSGSGSALFGIFRKEPKGVKETFPACFTFTAHL
ncbi:MAG: 4-(cytidine 5'-diphospho)-2-C-methyl-D-erythritol kinase, partial [Prevotella sp.]|nr:4-(cytidine 5'-diphospho)-2-C-methyl-D-erythritol kinase [Prevotella sp.]